MADEGTSGPAPHRSATRYAVKAALIYLVVFSIWIVASDRVIDTLTSGWLEDAIATWKGLFAVAASGVGVFLLVRRFGRDRKSTRLNSSH